MEDGNGMLFDSCVSIRNMIVLCLLLIPLSRIHLCLSEETIKGGGPFCLVSMPGEVKDPTQVNV